MNLLENLYKSLSHEKIWGTDGLTPLDKFTANSGGFTACCPNPAHPDKTPSFLMKEGIPAGKCQSCGYHLTWFDAAAIHSGHKDRKVKGRDFWQVFNTLSSLNGGLHLDISPEDKAKYEIQHEIQNLYNNLSKYLHIQLLENSWAENTRKYLDQRGVPINYLPRFPMLGFYPLIEKIEQYLLSEGFSPEIIAKSNVLQKCFQNCCLIFSYKDDLENTLGFKGRKPSIKVKDIKYQKGFKGELKDRAIMGLECCNTVIKNGERAVLVEGEFDWITAQLASIKEYDKTAEFICFGGTDIKSAKLETLKKAGAKVLYLSFDADTAGKKATSEAIKYAEKLDLCPFVVNLPAGSDPDDFIKSQGFEAYKNLVKNSSTAGEWLKQEFLQKYHPLNKENIEKAKVDLIEEAKNHKGFILDSFLELTAKELNIDQELIRQKLEQRYQELHKNIEAQLLKNSLPSAPVTEEYLIPTGWILNQNGLIKLSLSKDGLKETLVAPAPFYVSSRSINLDSKQEKLELTYLRDKIWKTIYEERAILLDHRKVVQLAGKGFPVNSLNCKDIVNFIHNFEAINDEKLPKQTTISGFGWKREKGSLFFVMPDKAYGTDLSIVFEPEGPGEEGFARALKPAGDFNTWKKAIRLLLPYPQVMFNLYASFTAPLLEILDAPNFIIDNWGLTSIGKTTTIEIAASVWGLPIKELGGLVRGWNATLVSVERLACLFNHLSIFYDDSQTANLKILDNMVYTIANGTGRQRGAVKGSQKISFWRTIAFSTGEKQLTQISELEGIKARIIDLYGSPFGKTEQSELIHEIKSIIHVNYGHAGRKFIEEIISRINNKSNDMLKKEYNQAYSDLAKLGKDNISDRLARYMGAVQVAGRLAEEIFDFGGEVKDIVRKIFLCICGEIKERGDYPQRALEHIVSWVQGNQNSFDKSDHLATIEKGEIFGVIREGEYIGIFPHKFKEIIKRSEFDTSSIIKAFKERSWIQTASGQNTYPLWFRSKKIRMIKLLWNTFKNLWE
jgi:DNA primase catalytic core